MNSLVLLLFPILAILHSANANIQLPWIKYVIDDSIPEFSIDHDNHHITTGEDLTIQCNISRLCLADYTTECTDPKTVQWFLPNTLPARDNSKRKQFSFEYHLVQTFVDHNTTRKVVEIKITSTLKLLQIGLIHSGHYECTSFLEQQNFNLKVRENAAHICTYHDQCASYNCYDGHCQCSSPEENYIPATKTCIKRAALGDACTSDDQCKLSNSLAIDAEFKQHLSPVKCLENSTNQICQCDPHSDVQVNLAIASTDVCLAKANLGSVCYSNEQCHAAAGADSFCGLDMRATEENRPNASQSALLLVCQCKDGWRSSSQNGASTCIPFTHCNSSTLGFNEHYARGDCPSNQFCRNGYCLCLPNYEFTASGGCVLQRGIDRSKSFLELYFWEILVTILLVTVLIFVMTMLQVVRGKRQRRRRAEAMRLKVSLREIRRQAN